MTGGWLLLTRQAISDVFLPVLSLFYLYSVLPAGPLRFPSTLLDWLVSIRNAIKVLATLTNIDEMVWNSLVIIPEWGKGLPTLPYAKKSHLRKVHLLVSKEA